MSDISKVIGNRIRILRNDMGLSLEELAGRAEINPTHLGRIERGEKSPKLDSLEKIVNALGITFEELFRYIRPVAKCCDNNNTTLSYLISRLNTLSTAEQKEVLNLVEIIVKLIHK